VAIGHPEQGGLWTLTTGVISAEVDNFNGVKGKNVFQTETGLNRGNSGGPLLDGEGHMIGINTAIVRVAPDGLPITSISFSLKSSVATQWLRDQHVAVLQANGTPTGTGQTKVATDGPTAPPVQSPQQARPIPAPRADVLNKPPVKPDIVDPSPARPYDLDQLISDRSRAEADLDGMISEMRGRMKGR
jgi:serine protease Do